MMVELDQGREGEVRRLNLLKLYTFLYFILFIHISDVLQLHKNSKITIITGSEEPKCVSGHQKSFKFRDPWSCKGFRSQICLGWPIQTFSWSHH